jgi:antitoxin component of RelBE/YafQ-DinJ toxin-antitoxin module
LRDPNEPILAPASLATLRRSDPDLDACAQLSLFEPMASTTLVRARVKTARVKKVTRILDRMGLKPADVVNMVFAQIEQRRALPFDVADAGDDYAFQEYGVTKPELTRFEKRLVRDIARERKAATIHLVKSADDLR